MLMLVYACVSNQVESMMVPGNLYIYASVGGSVGGSFDGSLRWFLVGSGDMPWGRL